MRWLLCVLLMHPFSVRAIPLQGFSTRELDSRNANLYINNGEPVRDRSIYTVTSLLCMMVLSLLLGSRFTRLKRSIVIKRSFMSTLLLALYILVVMFIICSAVLVAGQGLYTHALCLAGTWVCLMFYTSIKAIIYVFLVERIHVVRAPFVSRRKDKIYLSCMTMVIVMYGAVAMNSYVNHVTELRDSDGRCHFGIRGTVSIPFTVVNFFTDFVLTGVFFYLLRPTAQLPATLGKPGVNADGRPAHGGSDTPARKNIRTLLWKSIIGSLLIEIPMAANMIQFVLTHGEELGMICLTICLIDVFWDALVIHWLTFSSTGSAADKDSTRSAVFTNESSLDLVLDRARFRQSMQTEVKGTTQCAVLESVDARKGIIETSSERLRESTAGLIRPAATKR